MKQQHRNGLTEGARIRPVRSLKRRTMELRRSILGLYVAIVTILAAGLLYSLHLSWISTLTRERESLVRHASSTSSLVKESMIDGSRILDVAKAMLEKSLLEGPLESYPAHRTLCSVLESFSIYSTSDTLGLLILLDREGKLLARNGEYPCPAYDLSDRGFFRDLRDDPERKFATGRLRIAKTTGQPVFHLSMPVHGPLGDLAAVVALQIGEKEIASTVRHMLSGAEDRITVMLPSGETAFVFPPGNVMPTPRIRSTRDSWNPSMPEARKRDGLP